MFMKKFLLFLMIAFVYIIHQDNWNWSKTDVVLGFLPIGLAYHAVYSVLAAVMMALLVKFAWPKRLEEVEPHEPPKDGQNEEKHG